MATKAQIEKAIFEREGFRVELELFAGKRVALPPYDYSAMAPQHWRVSDWKNARLEAYRLLARGVTVRRGNGEPINRDLRLGNLRDTYYAEVYGSLHPPREIDTSNVLEFRERRPRSTRKKESKP